MTASVKRKFDITFSCDEEQAKVLCNMIHSGYMKQKELCGPDNKQVKMLRVMRNAFADAIGINYTGKER